MAISYLKCLDTGVENLGHYTRALDVKINLDTSDKRTCNFGVKEFSGSES